MKLNKRLQNRPRPPSGLSKTLPIEGLNETAWWRQFASDFFDDDATLSLSIPGEEKQAEYTIGRTLIPRFFKSYFDGGVTEFAIKLLNTREKSNQPGFIILDCDQTVITTKNTFRHQASNTSLSVIVDTEGHLSVEFVKNNLNNLLIKQWKFYANHCKEFVERTMVTGGVPPVYLAEPVTRFGLTKNTYAFLKMCMIMEPMQDLMLQHRLTDLDPRACLKQLLYDRFKLKNIDDPPAQPTKRRRRKPMNSEPGKMSGPTKKNQAANNTNASTVLPSSLTASNMPQSQVDINCNNVCNELPSLPLASQDILIVGEPMLGADFGDENERKATRLENDQYDPTTALDSNNELNQNAVQQLLDSDNTIGNENDYDKSLDQIDFTNDQHHSAQIIESPNQSEASNHEPQIKLEEPDLGRDETLKINGLPTVNSHEDSSNHTAEEKPDAVEANQHITSENSTSLPTVSVSFNTGEQSRSSPTNENTTPEINQNQADDVQLPTKEPSIQNKENNKEDIKENTNEESPVINSTDSLKSISSGNSNNSNSNSTVKKGIIPSNKQNRRRSSERKETLREGLMRTSDFVIAMKDLKLEHPSLWRITTGNNLLQQFEPKSQNGVILFENTNQYAGWNPEIRKDYVGVDVRLTQHTRNQITVERLLLNFQKMEDAEAFYDRHFTIYMQILISTALDPKFWESIEKESKHHDYFITTRKIIDEIIKRYKLKLSAKLKLPDHSLKEFEKYPNLIIKPITETKTQKNPVCRACNSNSSTQEVTFENRSYDLYTFKSVKVTNEPTKSDSTSTDEHRYHLCDCCLEIVRLFSDLHHMSWKFFMIAREKVEQHRVKGKAINVILEECINDEEWMTKVSGKRDMLWSKVEQLQ